jgi:hypothetical protein
MLFSLPEGKSAINAGLFAGKRFARANLISDFGKFLPNEE